MSAFTTTDGRKVTAQFYGFAADVADIDYMAESDDISAAAQRAIEARSEEGIWKLVPVDGDDEFVTDTEYHSLRP